LSGTYNIDRDPPVTHTMIYLGREKRTKKRVMIGSTTSYLRWQTTLGRQCFRFQTAATTQQRRRQISPVFVGYGRIPGLVEE